LLLLALVQHILGLGILVAIGTFGRWRVVALFELSKIPLPQAFATIRTCIRMIAAVSAPHRPYKKPGLGWAWYQAGGTRRRS
jgi:hypothetical protein